MNWRSGPLATKWIPVINAAESHYVIPRDFSARQLYEESRFNPAAHNPSGAVGIAQLLPKYFPNAGRNPLNDISVSAEYLRHLYDERIGGREDWQLALAAYDWGPSNLEKWIKKGGTFATLPPETRKYVSQIVADVPVKGILCKTPSLQSPQGGYLQLQPSVVQSSAAPLAKSWWQRLTTSSTPQLGLPQQEPSTRSVSLPSDTSSQTVVESKTQEMIMSNAAAPALIAVLQGVKQFIANLGTDPMQVAVKFPGALSVLLGTVEMQLPTVASAEFGTLQAAANARIDSLIASLQASAAAGPT